MRGLALVLWGLGVVGGIYYGEGAAPHLKATYLLSADRWRQGQHPYETLAAPADPLTLWIFKKAPAYGTAYLLFWKGLGGLLLVGFLLRKPSQEKSPTSLHWAFVGVIGGLYQALPYTKPLEVGETAYALALWLGESARRPFLKGILLSILVLWHPASVWALVFWLYRRWENQEGNPLLYHLLGLAWGSSGLLALIKVLWGPEALKAYLANYILHVWEIGIADKALWVLGGVSLILLILHSSEVSWQPYRERVLFRRVLWAGLSALGWGARAYPGMTLFAVRIQAPFLRLAQILLGITYLGYGSFLLTQQSSPEASLPLAPGSCLLGKPSMYITPEGPYGCDLTVPYDWSAVESNWEVLYHKLHEPDWIYDMGGYMATFRYHLPRKLAPYQAVDTALPVFIRLYRRKSETPPLWLTVPPKRNRNRISDATSQPFIRSADPERR